MSGVIVAGMHRSGTSLMAGVLAAGGWHSGEHLIAIAKEVYNEDESFVAIHRSWLDATVPPGNGHHDWGISDGGVVPGRFEAGFMSEAAETVRQFTARRDAERGRWVAKDPRVSLFLPPWLEHSDAKVVAVYRTPWDVLDSAMRLGFGPFCARPRLVLGAWLDHNRRILEVVRMHPERCILVASEALRTRPEIVWRELDAHVGMDNSPSTDLVDRDKFVRRGEDHRIARVYDCVYPEHSRLLGEMDRWATVARDTTADPLPDTPASPRHVRPSGSLPAGTGVQVIIPCRDDGDFLAEAVASVEQCADAPLELTIVDDGSTDDETLRILAAFRARGNDVITTSGVGLAAARNQAAGRSTTAAVLPLDADNRIRRPLLAAIGDIEDGIVDIVHGPWERFGIDSGTVHPPEMTVENLLPMNTIDACALIRRETLNALGGWDSSLPFWEDWDLWLGAVGLGARTRLIRDTTHDYLVRPGSLSTLSASPDGAMHDVVAHVTDKHAPLLGQTTGRLVREVLRLHQSHRESNRHLEWLGRAHQDLLDQHAEQTRSWRENVAALERRRAEIADAKDVRIRRLQQELAALRAHPGVRALRCVSAVRHRLFGRRVPRTHR